MTCVKFESCNIDPVVWLVIVICLLAVAAVVSRRGSMAVALRGAVVALLGVLVRLIQRRENDHGQEDRLE